MLSLIILIAAAMLPLSIWLIVRNPFNVAAILSFLTWAFGVIPGIIFQSTGAIVSYSWRSFLFSGGPMFDPSESMATLMLLCLMGAGMTLGSLVGLAVTSDRAHEVAVPHQTSRLSTFVMAGLWGLSAFYFFDLSGASFSSFLLPEKEGYQTSGYLEVVFNMMPLALALKLFWGKGRLDPWSLFWLLMAVLATFSRHQRRDLVTTVFFIIAMLVLVGELLRQRKAGYQIREAASSWSKRLMVFALFGLGAALVPLLWYARVYSTSGVDSLQIRSFSDILFGSPATGYPTLSVIRDYVSRAGTHLLYIPTYIGGALMPDQYWPRIPEDLDSIIENYYRLPENPSSFWFGELYFSLGSLAVPLAFGVGIVTFWLSQSANKSSSLLARSFGVIAFMQSITLYKNGFSVFAINSIAMSTFVLFAWFMPTLWGSRTSPAVPIFRLRAEREGARSTTAADLR